MGIPSFENVVQSEQMRSQHLRSMALIAGVAFSLGVLFANFKTILVVGHLLVLDYHFQHPVIMLSGHPAQGYHNELAVAEWMERNGLNDALVDYLSRKLNDPNSYVQIGAVAILQVECGEHALRALPEINRLIASSETAESVREDLRGLRKDLLDRYCGGGVTKSEGFVEDLKSAK